MSVAVNVYPKYWWDNEDTIITPAIEAVHARLKQFSLEQRTVLLKAIEEAESAVVAAEQEFNADAELVAFGEFMRTADDDTKRRVYHDNPEQFQQRDARYAKAAGKIHKAKEALSSAKLEASTMEQELQDAVPELIFCAGHEQGLADGARLLLSYLAPQLKQVGVNVNLPASVLALLADKPSAKQEA